MRIKKKKEKRRNHIQNQHSFLLFPITIYREIEKEKERNKKKKDYY